jgi:maleylpyruvate isomerase
MPRDLRQTIGFVELGTSLCTGAIASLDEDAFGASSELPGWTRRHVVAHLAANAEAIGRLLHWARTGERTPMYASPQQRAAEIEAGARRSGAELLDSFERTAKGLAARIEAMPAEAWAAEVVTAQGRTVPASEAPWMRSREVMVHAVDLGTGVTFADLPTPFLAVLRDEIIAKRASEDLPELAGDLPAVTAYLAGRGSAGVTTTAGAPVPELSPWL